MYFNPPSKNSSPTAESELSEPACTAKTASRARAAMGIIRSLLPPTPLRPQRAGRRPGLSCFDFMVLSSMDALRGAVTLDFR